MKGEKRALSLIRARNTSFSHGWPGNRVQQLGNLSKGHVAFKKETLITLGGTLVGTFT